MAGAARHAPRRSAYFVAAAVDAKTKRTVACERCSVDARRVREHGVAHHERS